MFSRTGAELFSWDSSSEHDRRPLLEVMSDPGQCLLAPDSTIIKFIKDTHIYFKHIEQPFMKALLKFPEVEIVANGCHDLTVPYPSAAITHFDPFDKFESTGVRVETDEHGCVTSWSLPSTTDKSSNGFNDNDDDDDDRGRHGQAETDRLMKRSPTSIATPSTRRRPKLPPIFDFRFPFNYVSLCPVYTLFCGRQALKNHRDDSSLCCP